MDEEATLLLRELLAEVASLKAAQGKPPTGKTLRELYELDEAAWTSLSWARSMRATLAPALKHFGDKKADDLTRADWQNYRDNVRAHQTTVRKGLPTPYTLNLEILRWRSLYRRQQQDGNCATNPLVGLRPLRGAKKHRETEPTTEDLAKLRAHCSPRLWAFVLLAFSRGFRASEARRLEWRQVDLDRGVIRLAAWQEKTKLPQTMRITSEVVAALRLIRPDVPGRYVFQGRSGPLGKTTLWWEFRQAADAAGLEAAPGDGKMTFHDQRHAAVSRWARKFPLQVTMRLSRHRSLQAAQRYIHVNDKDLESAYEQLEQDASRKPAIRSDPESASAVNPESLPSKGNP